jgi:hypothetical protein
LVLPPPTFWVTTTRVVTQREETNMSMYGANPDELANLGNTLTRQIDAITQVMGMVDSALNGTTWQGPARERFAAEWSGSFKQALGKLNEAFGLAGKDCVVRADELRRVMGSG